MIIVITSVLNHGDIPDMVLLRHSEITMHMILGDELIIPILLSLFYRGGILVS